MEDPRWADVFDGIDLDWEYPNACGLSCDTSGPAAFKNMMQAMRAKFGTGNLVTAAVTADGSTGGKIDAADYGGAAQYVELVQRDDVRLLRRLGRTGPDRPALPAHLVPRHPAGGLQLRRGDRQVQGARACPSAKLLLGIGFYGRGWTGVTQSAPGGRRPDAAPGTYEQGIEDYKVLKNSCPANGTVAGTAYAHCGTNWWSYDTPATIGSQDELGEGARAWEARSSGSSAVTPPTESWSPRSTAA